MVRELRRGGREPAFERVETAEALTAALNEQSWDVILADFKLPHFSGLAALELVKEHGLDLPFIVVSGTIGDDVAVAAMKAGAHDYLMKGNLARLVPAVERELKEAEGRRERRRAEAQAQWQNAIVDAIDKVFRESLTCETEEEVAQTCLGVAEELTASKFGFICEVNHAGRMDTIAVSDPGWDACRIPKTTAVVMLDDLEIHGIRGKVIKDERPLVCNDPASHPAWAGIPEGHPAITSFLGVPLKHAERTIGMIGLGNTESGYDPADQQAIEAISVSFVEALKRKRAERVTQEAQAYSESIVDTVREPLVILDAELRVLSANRSFYQTFRVTAEETVGQLLYDLGNGQWDVPPLRKMLEEILPTSTTVEAYEVEHEFETIGRRIMLLHARRIYREATTTAMVLLAIEDITERKRAEEVLERLNSELDHKNKELESVLYVASHDLWSPLVNIKGFSGELDQACKAVRSLVRGATLPDDLKEQLETAVDEKIPRALDFIVASVTKMDMLLAGLLRLSRLGQAAIHPALLDMKAMLAGIAKSFEFQVREMGATLQIDDLPPCLGDATQVNQVFSNLLDNAIKYLDPARSGVIRIHGQQEKGWATYCVEDNGIGIAPDDQDRVFEVFHRLNPDGPTTGEGLGLTTVRRIVDRQEGQVRLESEPGKGSRFFVSLPAKAK
jgi:PAS domain S-box-containing protein